MKFKYKRYDKILRPVIPIILAHKKQEIGYEILIDSGADLCLFHADIAEILGIKLERGEKKEVFGIGGKASIYYLHPVTLKVGGWSYKIQAGFMPRVSGRVVPYGVVGQRGFFEHFKVVFDLQKESIELKRK